MYKVEWRGYNMYTWLEDFGTNDRCEMLINRYEKRERFLRRYKRIFLAVKVNNQFCLISFQIYNI